MPTVTVEKVENDRIVFSTGNSVYANCGIVGISMDMQMSRIELSEGYDGRIHDHWMTREERQALAAWAIDLWKRYAEQEVSDD